ncbi:MAG: PA2779 family protein [Gammaproteobacteria bacterium]|nr:PA2779 family protein [Gammaproteobacteria bacterium]
MDLMRRCASPIVRVQILALLFACAPVPGVNAAMLGTRSVLEQSASEPSDRTRVDAFLAREDVGAAFRAQGIDPFEARIRVDSLTDAEIRRLATQIDRLPAGGSSVGAIVGALLLVFVVLLITDLLGLTHVFPFVNR